ncbi:protoheme IX farnesyltransferase, mitochondrial isoform X2 [Phyllopteryx taeniolatus]|uniref:protoheme IX farnesyltransferase, mitochondrial isoform X2 n=1 Tax=Phyllopteryx taeniolatus TaxID=161469 RepID=UPI002AD32AF6|nr:protoheme IX farnesyltransferase, mitochondrial isoform X2 [Phyllopteryx taeniolatus]
MYKTQCSRLTGLFGVSIKQKLVGCGPRCKQMARGLLLLQGRDPTHWMSYQHLNFLKRQYVSKNLGELHQHAVPKQAAVLADVDESDGDERQVQRIPTVDPVAEEVSTSVVVQETPNTVTVLDETPHVQVETDEAREARLDRQWKQLKVEAADLPDVYARLAKIKLTALVVTTAAAGYAMAPVPFDPAIFLGACLGTGLASSAANSINQYFEVPFDSNMNRTKNRPLVRGQIRCSAVRRLPVQLAVPALQCPQLEPERGLLARRLPHDVGHAPGNVSARGPAAQRGTGWPCNSRARAGCHHVDLPPCFAAHQRIHYPAGLPILPEGRPHQRPQAFLLQPVAPSHAVAACAHLQEASRRRR